MLTEFFPPASRAGPLVSGGIESRCYYVARELAKEHEVTVIASHVAGTQRRERVEGVEVIRCGKERKYSQGGALLGRLTFMREAYRIGLDVEADVVEGSNFISHLPAYRIAKKKKVPAVAWYADSWVGEWVKNVGIQGILGELLERYALTREWSGFIAISTFTKQKLVRAGVDASRIEVLPTIVDVEGIESVQASKSDVPTICCVARLVEYKRVEDLIQAVALLQPQMSAFRGTARRPFPTCRIIGRGPKEETLRQLSGDLGVLDKIEFLGSGFPHEDIYRLMKSATIFCLPSIVEGFGAVVAEAMACGTPYVCSDIAPLKEVTDNGVGGLLFRAQDPQSLASCLLRLFTDNALYDQCVRAGRALARRYDCRVVARQTADLYRRLRG